MNDFFRFLIGLFLFILAAAVLVVASIFLLPIVAGVALVALVVFFVLLAVFLIVAFFAFIWYISRKQPKLKDNKDYSMDQGRDA